MTNENDVPIYQSVMWLMAFVGILGGIVLPLAGVFYLVHVSLLAAAFDLILFIQTHFVTWAFVGLTYIVVRILSILIDKTRKDAGREWEGQLEYGLFWLFSVSITFAIKRFGIAA